jgi:hypothetical protein
MTSHQSGGWNDESQRVIEGNGNNYIHNLEVSSNNDDSFKEGNPNSMYAMQKEITLFTFYCLLGWLVGSFSIT